MKNFISYLLIFTLTIFLFTNCEKEDVFQDNSSFQLNQKKDFQLQLIQNNFSLNNHQEEFIKSNLKVKWQKYTVNNIADSTVSYEFDTNLKAKMSPVNDKNNTGSIKDKKPFYTKFKIQAIIDKNNEISFRVLKYISNEKNGINNLSLNSLNGFSGTVYHFNIDGEMIKIEAFEKGSFIQEYKGSSNEDDFTKSEAPVGGSGLWVPFITISWVDWYKLGGGNIWYSHSSNSTVTVEWLYIETGGSGGASGGTYHSHYAHPSIPAPDIDIHPDEILIDPSFEGTKGECVYNKLNSSSTGFKKDIKKFDGEFPVAHLKFENVTTLPNNVNARTLPPENYIITIQINGNNLSRPNLSIARTLIHEAIHAEMFRKILSIMDNGGNLDGMTIQQWTQKLSNGDYPGIFDYYSRYGVNGMQHEQIAAHYRTTISDILEEFLPGLSQDIYDAMAWEGLKGTSTWNSLSQQEKDAINSIINSYNNLGSETCN